MVTAAGRPKALVFFIHGRSGDSSIWLPLISTFRFQFRCINLDLPGFGPSYTSDEHGFSLLDDVELVGRIIDYFATNGETAGLPVVLVGHDVGGAISQLCALAPGRSISAMILINSPSITHPPEHFSSPYGFAGTRAKLLRSLLDSRLSVSEIESLFERAWKNRAQRRKLVRALYSLETTWPGPETRRKWASSLSTIKCPTLLLRGGRDRLSSQLHLHDLMRRLPDAYLFEDETSSHWPCLENTPWVIHKMREFLFRVPLSPRVTASRKWKSA